MKKWFAGVAALAAAMCFGATTEDGVTKERRGALGPNDTVVTDVDATGIVTARTYTKDEVDRRIATNAPVRSVNGKTGRVVIGAGDVGALPNNRDGLKANANFRNAVWDVQIKPSDANAGAARVLPPYLHEIEFDSTYPADAAWYYSHADYSDAGMCSVRRAGNVIERNFDWKFDFMPEFVLRTTAAEGRFASLGIASVGKLLTENDVISGKWSPYYRCLPGHTVDGVNEKGVFCEVNVVDGEPDWDNPGGDIHPLGGVRWVLDYGTNAQQAAEALASRIAFPAGWSQNFHYLVADKDGTWIVENGAAYGVTGAAVMTNFKLYPSRDTDGAGQERYDLLADGEPITNAWWTLAYLAKTHPVRVSDIGTDTNAIFDAWANGDRESRRGQSAGGKTWWQTVHTAVYDLGNLSLRVCVQERGEWYEFSLRVGGGGVDDGRVRDIVRPMISAATNAVNVAMTNRYTKAETDSKIAEAVDANEKTGTAEQIVRGELIDGWSKIWGINVMRAESAEGADYAGIADTLPWAYWEGTDHPTTLTGYGITDAAPLSMISATDPTFSNAVLAVQVAGLATNITAEVYTAATNACANLGIDPSLIPGAGTTGTVGGLLVMLFATVFWMKKKIFDNSGKIQNDFATDLLGKQVANAKLQTIEDKPTIEDDGVTLLDGSAATVDTNDLTSTTLNVTFDEARNGGLRICELYILNGTATTDLTFDAATVSFVSTGDSFPACEAGINYFVFAEVAANLWKVTRETLKSITTPTPVAAA